MPAPGWSRSGDHGDFGGHISTEPRINDRIRVPEVRLVGPSGEQVGIVSITDALRLAQESDLDLVEVAPTARPPVCKLMDFGKFKYESALKARESRKNQAQTVIKEIKIRPKIDPHDYGTKKGHVERFLRQGDKVKVTIMFRGREQSRPELGYKLLQRLAGDVEELGFVESAPKQDGRNMIMVIGPHKKKAEAKAVRTADRASARAAAPGHQAGADGQVTAARSAAAQPVVTAPAGNARSTSASGSDPASTGTARPAPAASRPAPAASRAAPAASRPAPAAPRPAPPRPAPSAAASSRPSETASARPAPAGTTRPASSGNARPSAPASASGPRPAAPRPAAPAGAAPRPGPSGSARPAAPKPGPSGARPTAPKPAPPRSAAARPAARPAEGSSAAAPRGRPGEQGKPGAEATG